jgi:hypothetical protein
MIARTKLFTDNCQIVLFGMSNVHGGFIKKVFHGYYLSGKWKILL